MQKRLLWEREREGLHEVPSTSTWGGAKNCGVFLFPSCFASFTKGFPSSLPSFFLLGSSGFASFVLFFATGFQKPEGKVEPGLLHRLSASPISPRDSPEKSRLPPISRLHFEDEPFSWCCGHNAPRVKTSFRGVGSSCKNHRSHFQKPNMVKKNSSHETMMVMK